MGKRQKEDDGEEDEGEKELRKAGAKLPSHIKNKHKRSEAYSKLKHEKVLDKKKRIKARDLAEKQALELGEVVRNFGSFLCSFLLFVILSFLQYLVNPPVFFHESLCNLEFFACEITSTRFLEYILMRFL
jgi:hypothetical protein